MKVELRKILLESLKLNIKNTLMGYLTNIFMLGVTLIMATTVFPEYTFYLFTGYVIIFALGFVNAKRDLDKTSKYYDYTISLMEEK
jgi:uncharacterized membrane protein